MKIVMVRHTSVAVEKGVCYGRTDVALNASFEAEAAEVRRRINAMKECDGDFDLVVSSPATRCVRLAHACGFSNPIIDPSFAEMDFGEWEMKRYSEITDPRIDLWYRDYQHVRATGGESFCDQTHRVNRAVEEYMERGVHRLLIFGHGGIAMQLLLLGGRACDLRGAAAMQPGFGGMIEVTLPVK